MIYFGKGILSAQTLGGSSIFNFLKMPQHASIGALGGRNVSIFKGDIGLISENPALLRETDHGILSTNFSYLAPSLNALSAIGAFKMKSLKTTFAVAINHIKYGNTDQTDASGNNLGFFNPYDQFIQFTAARSYNKRWYYGLSLKYIRSVYGPYISNGVAADIGLTYFDEENLFQAGFAAKNMGTQLKTYAGIGEDLPFDMVVGVTKQLEKAPIRFSLTAQRLHQFDLIYNDTMFNAYNFTRTEKNGFANKILSHFIFATEIFLGEKLTLSGGYNFLRRKELRILNLASGLTGFNYGMNLKLNRLLFYFSRSHYQSSTAHAQFGLTYKFATTTAQK